MGFTRTNHGDLSARGVGTIASMVGSIRTKLGEGHLPSGFNTLNASFKKSSFGSE